LKTFNGVLKARMIEARFPWGGKIAKVNKFAGDSVKKWDVIASLDKTTAQLELDRELADFERTRADFEIFAQKNKEPQNDLEKYLKMEKQAALNSSVKSVELSKTKLDQAVLLSPVDGLILEDSGIVAGINITPAGSSIKIIDSSSFFFEIEFEGKDIPFFREEHEGKIKLESIDNDFPVKSGKIVSDGEDFKMRFPLPFVEQMLLGLKGALDI
jgi:multidrug resistance efflux pump